MPKPEIKGNSLRFRIKDSDKFTPDSFKTIDVGKPGRLQLIMGMDSKNPNKFEIQSIRMNLTQYSSLDLIYTEIDMLIMRNHISKRDGIRGKRLSAQWYKKNRQ